VGSRPGWVVNCRSRLPRPHSARDTTNLFRESTIPPGDPPRGPREGTQARIPRSIPKPRVPTPLGGLRVVCVRPYLTECGEPARDKNGLAGRRRIKAQTPSRPTDPHSVTECTLNGTLTCEGPFNGAECYRNGGNPWEKGLGGGRRFLGSPTLPQGRSPASGTRVFPRLSIIDAPCT